MICEGPISLHHFSFNVPRRVSNTFIFKSGPSLLIPTSLLVSVPFASTADRRRINFSMCYDHDHVTHKTPIAMTYPPFYTYTHKHTNALTHLRARIFWTGREVPVNIRTFSRERGPLIPAGRSMEQGKDQRCPV